jgi:hypothetical protein
MRGRRRRNARLRSRRTDSLRLSVVRSFNPNHPPDGTLLRPLCTLLPSSVATRPQSLPRYLVVSEGHGNYTN